jgi:hypothetical protein
MTMDAVDDRQNGTSLLPGHQDLRVCAWTPQLGRHVTVPIIAT